MIRQFLILHAFATILHLSCAVYSFSLNLSYTALLDVNLKRVSFSNFSTEFPYYREYDTLNFKFLSVILIHGIVALVTLLFHTVIYAPSHYYYSETIWKQGFFTVRWIEYAITCTLMSISSVISSGSQDFNMVITIIYCGIALQFVGATIEQSKRNWKILLFIGVFVESGIGWSIVWHTLTSPAINELQWIETISYAFYYSLFPLNCVLDASYRKHCFVRTDWIYNVLSLSSKFSLFWLQVGEVEKNLYNNIWSYLEVYLLGIFIPFCILCIGLYFTPKCTKDTIPCGCNTLTIEKKNTFLSNLVQWRILKKEHEPTNIYVTRRGRNRF